MGEAGRKQKSKTENRNSKPGTWAQHVVPLHYVEPMLEEALSTQRSADKGQAADEKRNPLSSYRLTSKVQCLAFSMAGVWRLAVPNISGLTEASDLLSGYRNPLVG